MKLDNDIAAVVTGGASGLGRASAEALAGAGVKVAIFDVNEDGGRASPTRSAGFSAGSTSPARTASSPVTRPRAPRMGRNAS